MTTDHVNRTEREPNAKPADTGRDARGRWKTGHCPNPSGRPKKQRREDYNPSDLRDFLNTQIEVATADGPQKMDRRTALLNKVFEGAMKGKATPMRMLVAEIKESDQRMAELRAYYERLEAKLIHENPDFKSIDESLTPQERSKLLGLASTLDHYYPGQYAAILGQARGEEADRRLKEFQERIAAKLSDGEGRD